MAFSSTHRAHLKKRLLRVSMSVQCAVMMREAILADYAWVIERRTFEPEPLAIPQRDALVVQRSPRAGDMRLRIVHEVAQQQDSCRRGNLNTPGSMKGCVPKVAGPTLARAGLILRSVAHIVGEALAKGNAYSMRSGAGRRLGREPGVCGSIPHRSAVDVLPRHRNKGYGDHLPGSSRDVCRALPGTPMSPPLGSRRIVALRGPSQDGVR